MFAGCPKWSPAGQELAFADKNGAGWALFVYRSGSVSEIAQLHDDPPTTKYQTFEWQPNGNVVFIDRTSIYAYRTAEGRLRPLVSNAFSGLPEPHSLVRNVRSSPDGSMFAVRMDKTTRVFRGDGTPLGTFKGALNGWAGNRGVLTLALNKRTNVITLYLNLFGRRPQAIVLAFKDAVVTDPGGSWFAYAPYHRPLVIQSPLGRPLRRVSTPFSPIPLEAIDGAGRVSLPVSAY
jgi:hypothetical protein